MSRSIDSMSKSLTSLSPIMVDEHNNEKLASFAVDPNLSPMEYSEPISYSGSVSVHSCSSTGSSHSFAFPILPSEWSGTPVRMARADKKELQRYRQRRRRHFLCCKF